jgi:hypothetical protein
MNFINQSFNRRRAAAGLFLIFCAHSGMAGYKSSLLPNGVGSVSASLAFDTTNVAATPSNFNQPSAGVTTLGTWTAKTNQPLSCPTVCTSTVSTVFLTGGYKAVARSYVATGVTADDADLGQKLSDEKFALLPGFCGASYDIASGDEMINSNRYLVVLGNATAGTAAWFRGYVFDGTPSSRDDIVANGTKLYDVIVKGPFDFGDPNSTDRCFALKIPIDYPGTNVYLLSDGVAVSASNLQFVNVPQSVTIGCSGPLAYPSLQTTGGCGTVNITFDPPISLLPPGVTQVTATAVDSANNVATNQFSVTRPPPLQFVNVPQSVTIGCSDPLVYPVLQTTGGCGATTVTYNPPANQLPPGVTLVTATAKDSNNNMTAAQFSVIRPFITFTGFYPPINGTSSGDCSVPLRAITAGNKIPIKFDTTLCGVTYESAVPPNVTITKINPVSCAVIGVPVDHQYFQWVANQWHFNWNTSKSDRGRYRIEVVLGDGSPNPFAIVDLQ